MIKYLLLILIFVFFIYLGYVWYRDTHRFEFTEYVIESPKIKKEMVVVHLSDLHGQSYGQKNNILVNAILNKKPYLILSTGDLYTASKKEDLKGALDLLEGLSAKVPIIIADGNHESKTKISPHEFKNRYERYHDKVQEISQKSMGITHINDETVFVDSQDFAITGFSLENKYFRHFRHVALPENYITEKVASPPDKSFRILLAHNPLYFDDYVNWGADLILAGHLHGGVIRLPRIGGLLNPEYSLFPGYDGGLYNKGEIKMIVSRGLGTHTIPLRLWNPAEIPVIKLIPAKKDNYGN